MCHTNLLIMQICHYFIRNIFFGNFNIFFSSSIYNFYAIHIKLKYNIFVMENFLKSVLIRNFLVHFWSFQVINVFFERVFSSNNNTQNYRICFTMLFHVTLGWPKKLHGQRPGFFSGFHQNSGRTDGQHGVCVQNRRQLVSHTI